MKLGDGREVETTRPVADGKYNVYDCEKGHPLLSLDIDEGVTSFMSACPDHPSASAAARMCRFLPVLSLFPGRMIWRRATQAEMAEADPALFDHYSKGGLHREWAPDKPASGPLAEDLYAPPQRRGEA